MGRKGAGHFVKMVHNGIEYAVLQLIAETYDILKTGLGKSSDEISALFAKWRNTEVSSYLVEISAEALAFRDSETDKPLVELVMDKAEQKGTGRWCVQAAAELGIPTPSIDAALSARSISALKQLRTSLSKAYGAGPAAGKASVDMVEMLRDAFWCTSLISFVQGLSLIQAASQVYDYGTNVDEVLRVWRAGCIIRASMLKDLRTALAEAGDAQQLLRVGFLASQLSEKEKSWRSVITYAKEAGIPTPVLDASYNYFLSIKRERLPANLIQALRDRFGSHGYERIDKPGRHHSSWRP
uniref:6-phosphogluconate dehydrogenase C-terminal domain-containing protein n=1 Tax=Caldiarchaeum subterraneum TaxID=311458 RepID=A0A7J3VSU9_CALS0